MISKTTQRLTLLLLAVVYFSFESFAQLQIYNAPVSYLVNDVFLGKGVKVKSFSFKGDVNQQIGYFTGGWMTNLGIDSGIILSTGDMRQAKGPNNDPNESTNLNRAGDNDLDNISGGETHDAAVLEIEVIPESDTLKFRYVFGSEEYPEYVGQFNDAFALFISGPGITGQLNIARIPGTGEAVTINNVNNGPADVGPCKNCSWYVSNKNGSTIEYDGFTRVFTATAVVIPCSTYKLKIAIADASDFVWDSGVFLEAKSLRSNTYDITASAAILRNHPKDKMLNRQDSLVYEDCDSILVRVKREGNTSKKEAVKLKIEGTAIMGLDYNQFPDSVVFEAGVSVVSFTIKPKTDAFTEGAEYVKITLILNKPCTTDEDGKSIRIWIRDPLIMPSLGPDHLLCPTQTVTLISSPVYPNIDYAWQDGTSANTYTVTGPGTYILNLNNVCGKTWADTVVVKYIDSFFFDLGNDTAICLNGKATKSVPLFEYASYKWSTGSTGTSITVSLPGKYWVTVSNKCQTHTDTFNVRYVDNLKPNLGNDTTVCEDEIVRLDAYNRDIIKYLWQDGSTQSFFEVKKAGTYYVRVETNCDVGFDTIKVKYLKKAKVNLGKDTIFCEEFRHKIDAGPEGVSYLWSPTGETSPSIVATDYGMYTVTVINSNGCTTRDTVRILPLCPPVVYVPNAFTPNKDDLNEVFRPSLRFVNSIDFSVYNRWGEKVFETSEPTRGWNGTYLSNPCPEGVYYWVLEYKGIDTHKRIYGTVTLLR